MIFSRQLAFQRKISFHPELNDALQKVLDELPPRQSTLIRAAALYSRSDIPWNELDDGGHQISVAGAPRTIDYRYSLSSKYVSPEAPEHMAGAFTLTPTPGAADGTVSSVIANLGGELAMDTYGAGAGLDAIAAVLREFHGDLKAPWDSAPDQFNHHDRAALSRLHRDMPIFAQHLEHYLRFHNLLDEFGTPDGPIVLFNLDADVKPNSLAPYPHLEKFYDKLATAMTAESAIIDSKGNYWMRTRFDRGRIHVIFMLREGMLTPFDASNHPAGESVAIDRVEHGNYRTRASVHISQLGMTFGLDDLAFATDFNRSANTLETVSRMNTVPQLVAPPGIHAIIDMIAGEFLRVMAQGNGGFTAAFSSKRDATGMYMYALGFRGEFNYSPTLEFLARIGDSIAQAHNEQVRIEERRLGEELFDAFVTDYNNARPKILALDAKRKGMP